MAGISVGAITPVKRAITITEFRKSPGRCFENSPVAVLARGRPVGYLLDPELFEAIFSNLTEIHDPLTLKREFGLSDAWLESNAAKVNRS